MEFTHTLPKTAGYYWFTDFGEHTPTVLRVAKDHSTGKLWACDEEFAFEVKKEKFERDPDAEPVDGKHYYGDQMWCKIPVPTMDGKKIEPSCY